MQAAIAFRDANDVHAHVGREVCVTDWVTIGQDRIDKFAEATGDFQWIHIDVERAKVLIMKAREHWFAQEAASNK